METVYLDVSKIVRIATYKDNPNIHITDINNNTTYVYTENEMIKDDVLSFLEECMKSKEIIKIDYVHNSVEII